MLCMRIHLPTHHNQTVILDHHLDAKPFSSENMLLGRRLLGVPFAACERSSGSVSIPPICNEWVGQNSLR